MTDQIQILSEKNVESTNHNCNTRPFFSNFPRKNVKFMQNTNWITDIHLPLSVFNNSNLSALETISKYLKEEIGLNYRTIASILGRNERTIWGSYNTSRKKMDTKLLLEDSKYFIPLSIFQDRSLGVLEALSHYMKQDLNLRFCQIAGLLNRDDRTVWTAHKRAQRKKQKNA